MNSEINNEILLGHPVTWEQLANTGEVTVYTSRIFFHLRNRWRHSSGVGRTLQDVQRIRICMAQDDFQGWFEETQTGILANDIFASDTLLQVNVHTVRNLMA